MYRLALERARPVVNWRSNPTTDSTDDTDRMQFFSISVIRAIRGGLSDHSKSAATAFVFGTAQHADVDEMAFAPQASVPLEPGVRRQDKVSSMLGQQVLQEMA